MTRQIKSIDCQSLDDFEALLARPHHSRYFAMYSSVFGGITTRPALMVVPADDHMVHRGDAVFDTLKFVKGGIYNLSHHLKRLRASAGAIHIDCPWSDDELETIVKETASRGGHKDGLIRILVSRGAGSFGASPFDCERSELYVIAYGSSGSAERIQQEGATAATSAIPPKADFWAKIKSCNYLPNVLMKREAHEAGVDFTLSIDADGMLAESATESVAVVTADGALLVPHADHVLEGTTLSRVLVLAESLIREKMLSSIGESHISRDMLAQAGEILIVGTTPNVTGVIKYDGKPVSGGQPGPIQRSLNALLIEDMENNAAMRTE
ncbi:MAG: aminotransferase class IV [Verrucomicrobia bacterium]|nr:aminotransferase class IV [Verrucomicrobiota bacterium]